MSSFFEGAEQLARTGKLSTHRNPAMKTLTLVVHEPTYDTPPTGIPALPHSMRPKPVEHQHTTPLPPVSIPAPTPMPTSMPVSSRQTASLRPVPTQTPVTSAQVTGGAKEMAQQGVYATFKILLWATDPKVMNQIDRRDRVVFLLLDGKRTIRDIARLVHRNELDIARTIVRLLKQGYIVNTGTYA